MICPDIIVDSACLQGTVAVLAPSGEMLAERYPASTEKAMDYFWSGVISTIEDIIELGANSFALLSEPAIASIIGVYLLTETNTELHCYLPCPESIDGLADEELGVWSRSIQHYGSLRDMLKESTAVLLIQQPPQDQDVIDLVTECSATLIPCDPDVLIKEIIHVDCFLKGLAETAHNVHFDAPDKTSNPGGQYGT